MIDRYAQSPAAPSARPARLAAFAPALALIAMTLCVYFPAMKAGFIWDDDQHFVEDRLMTAPDGLRRIWFAPNQSVWNYWPISRSSFWIERRLWGVNATASHALNLLLHLTAVLILYRGLQRFRVPHAWFVAALFAVHPLFVESVAWLTERKNLLSGIFFLLCLWSYLAFDETRRPRHYGTAVFLFLAGLLSKSSIIMAPVIFILCRLALRRPWHRRDILPLIPFFLLSVLSAGASVWFEEHVVGSRGTHFARSSLERLAVAGRIPWFYLGKILFPHPLLFNYPRWELTGKDLLEFAPLLALGIVALALLRHWSTWGRLPALGLGAFVIMLFPVLGFFDIYGMRFSFVADHWAYLPALPVLLLAGAGLAALRRRARMVHGATCVFVLLGCAFLTWKHTHSFRDEETLWRHTLAGNPSSWLAHNNLGVILQEAGRLDDAVAHHRETLRLRPDYEQAFLNLGSALQRQGRLDEAIASYLEAIRLHPDYAKAHLNAGLVRQRQGRLEESVAHFREALRSDPGFEQAHLNLGNVFLARGEIADAIGQYRDALRLNPRYAQAHNNLGTALFRIGEVDAAIECFQTALQIQPVYPEAKDNLAKARLSQGRGDAP